MFDQMPARIQQRLTNALDNKCAPITGPHAPSATVVVSTGVTAFTCSTEGESLSLSLTLTCTIPWVAYRRRAFVSHITPCRPLCYGVYQLNLGVLVFGRRLQLLAAKPLTPRDSAAMACRAVKALEMHYLNFDYLWRELFD